ncbi:hypothetical protein DFQ27_002128 [Actinomortierella ambigua]|uniref:Uncharacterized protein n=1 Tax=Actinomortierella ambigua TaxID=1343610 RepID=A0A9P6QA52_9FUNG|nr:hypothetical protein DFQ27_002128 [Actinomortierella ambigua]
MPVDKQERNHEEEQEEDDDEKSKDQVEEAILGLIEDSMLVIDLRFLINDTPVDLQENALSRGHIVNGIFSPET